MLWACGGVGQLGRVQLPVKRVGVVVVGKLLRRESEGEFDCELSLCCSLSASEA